jgi:Type IV secretion system pilin
LFALLLTFALAPLSRAFDLSIIDGASAARGIDQAADLFGASGIFTTISNVMLFAVGAISVIMIVIGGLRYVVSGGNTTNVTAAKNTILYAIVGLVISMLAYAIINFVISSFMSGGVGGGTNV